MGLSVVAESVPQFGDRRTYPMDPGNAREAIKRNSAILPKAQIC